MSQGIERVPDSLGYLVINEDGAVLSSGGDLENDEKLADKMMNMVYTAVKMASPDKQNHFKRLSVIWESFIYVMTISNHRVYICKRRPIPHEPMVA